MNILETDFLVIGSGIAGLMAAHHLSAQGRVLVATFFFNLLIYWVIVIAQQGLDYYRQFQERGIQTAELETRLTEALSGNGVLRLSDVKGRTVIVPADKITYLELGSATSSAVGFR